jgi:hypothetical protein
MGDQRLLRGIAAKDDRRRNLFAILRVGDAKADRLRNRRMREKNFVNLSR